MSYPIQYANGETVSVQHRVRKPAIANVYVVRDGFDKFADAIARDRMTLQRIEIEIKLFPGPVRFFR